MTFAGRTHNEEYLQQDLVESMRWNTQVKREDSGMKRIIQDDFTAQPATDDSGIVIFKFFSIITKIDGWRDLPRATRAIL